MTRPEEGNGVPRFWRRAYRALLPLLPHGLRARQGDVTRAAVPSGTVFDAMLFSIPYTAAFTIPMSVFIAVLWAASRRPTWARSDDPFVSVGALRLAPIIGMASVVALCCLALNAELVPRANLRLQAMYAGRASVAPSDRSMTLHELREAEARLARAPGAAPAVDSDGASVASYAVEIQKKFALAASCVLLAMLAGGIASRTSRISLWAQAGISLVVFGGYYVCIITGEHLADRSAIPPAVAMWSANIIVLLLAMLTLRVARGRRGSPVRPPSPTV